MQDLRLSELIGALSFATNQLNFGIDFESGTRIKTELVKKADKRGSITMTALARYA